MNEPVKIFRDLDVWQVAMELTVVAYSVAKQLPQDERYGLSAQLRRAAVSVPANIAEGHANRSDGRLASHLSIALGSLAEVETIVELGLRLGLLTRSEVQGIEPLIARTGQLLHGLRRRVRLKAQLAP